MSCLSCCPHVWDSRRKKEDSQYGSENNSQVKVDLEGEEINSVYSSNDQNDCSGYKFGGVAGNYFGYSSIFRISDKALMEFTFGTALSQKFQIIRS